MEEKKSNTSVGLDAIEINTSSGGEATAVALRPPPNDSRGLTGKSLLAPISNLRLELFVTLSVFVP